MRRRTAARIVVASAIVLALVAAVAAYSYWSTSGSGTATAGTGSGATVTVVQTSSATGLYPGGSVALAGDFDNPNAGAVYVTAVTATVHAFSAQSDGAKPACTAADFTITGTSNTPGSIVSGSGVGSWDGLTLTMLDTGANQDNCKSLSNIEIDYIAS